MKNKYQRITFFLFLIILNFRNPAFATKSIEQAGDVLQILIPASAYASTLYLNDKQGQHQFYKSITSTLLVTYSLKNSVNKKRPNGGIHSFPSGHTSVAFQGAAFIHRRYGFKSSLAAYLAAIFVAYSRVESRFHFNEDVVAGAAIGIISNIYTTTTYQKIIINPVIGNSQFEIQIIKQF